MAKQGLIEGDPMLIFHAVLPAALATSHRVGLSRPASRGEGSRLAGPSLKCGIIDLPHAVEHNSHALRLRRGVRCVFRSDVALSLEIAHTRQPLHGTSPPRTTRADATARAGP